MTKNIVFGLFFLFAFCESYAQLGFCSGSKGDPIFHEDFGDGTGFGPPLSEGTTNYEYVTSSPGRDGSYAITDDHRKGDWYAPYPQTTISNGRAFVVNASYTAGLFYQKKVNGLCANATYEFSAFLINLLKHPTCGSRQIPINVRFEIWDASETRILKEGSTGDIFSSPEPRWDQFALTFQSKEGEDSVILKMFNNGVGGCGNDLAIDDIIFRYCRDITTKVGLEGTMDEKVSICVSETPVKYDLQAVTAESSMSSIAYLWQFSEDGESWVDLPELQSNRIETPSISSSSYFRVKVAEDTENLKENLCSSVSNEFFVEIIESIEAPISTGDIEICNDEPIPDLTVSVPGNQTVNWYDSAEGGNLLAENTLSYSTENSGTYYAQAILDGAECSESSRTPVTLSIYDRSDPEIVSIQKCSGESLTLDAGIDNANYDWSTGETAREIEVYNEGVFSVFIQTGIGCPVEKRFEITITEPGIEEELIYLCDGESLRLETGEIATNYFWSTGRDTESIEITSTGVFEVLLEFEDRCPKIKVFRIEWSPEIIILEVLVDDNQVTILSDFQGEAEYSIDGTNFQSSNVFYNIQESTFTAYVRDLQACSLDFMEVVRDIATSKFFTPNGDGFNDYFSFDNFDNYPEAEIMIFDRYGKLLKYGRNIKFMWDGKFNGRDMPSDDYWYKVITKADGIFTGHFSLVRSR